MLHAARVVAGIERVAGEPRQVLPEIVKRHAQRSWSWAPSAIEPRALSREEAVRCLSEQPADIFSLHDRGRIAPGLPA